MRISHEAIYQALYIQERGALRRELTACLRSGRALRLPRERARNRGKSFLAEAIMISERPAEIEDKSRPRTLGRRSGHIQVAHAVQHAGVFRSVDPPPSTTPPRRHVDRQQRYTCRGPPGIWKPSSASPALSRAAAAAGACGRDT